MDIEIARAAFMEADAAVTTGRQAGQAGRDLAELEQRADIAYAAYMAACDSYPGAVLAGATA